MRRKLKIVVVIVLSVLIFAGSNIINAKTSDEVMFNDKNLQDTIIKYYELTNSIITKDNASILSKQWYNTLVIEKSDVSDLEGLQYFDKLITFKAGCNNLTNLKPISMLKKLEMLDISDNAIKGRDFETDLNNVGKVRYLNTLVLTNNELTDIGFLSKIGTLKNYTDLRLEDNKISDISILNDATNLKTLDLSNNRITDVSSLKDLKNLKYWLGLQDNCILDYKPIKPILDKIYEDGGWDGVISRYDYYTNPVDIGINGKTVKFPYLTAYYKYQAYVEAIPLFKALGGSAKYDKKTGTLTCKYDGNVLVMKDFSNYYTLNGKKISMKYPMRRMQYDLAYVPVKDICKALGLKYSVTKNRKINETEDEFFYAPKYIEISQIAIELG
jgi:hypothetical protein